MNKGEISPYSFEPLASNYVNLQRQVENSPTNTGRIGNINWCICENCIPMDTNHESHCCCESKSISELKGGLTCITLHDSFHSVVFNLDTLQASRYQMLLRADNVKRERLNQINNSLWRHTAYKQFVYWMNAWVPLGKSKRKIIPACVISRIRETYQDESNTYVGFQMVEGVDPEYFD